MKTSLARRMAAVLHHREVGFRANAMGVWVVPADRAEDVGRVMGSFKGVSHCYLRPTYPDWPYSIFTMVHGADAKGCQEVIDAMAQAFAPLRLCLFVEPVQVYRGRKVRLEAVLANEDVLAPGKYPARLMAIGPNAAKAWERRIEVMIPDRRTKRCF